MSLVSDKERFTGRSAPGISFKADERSTPDIAPRRNIAGMAGWALTAMVAIGVGVGTAAMVERPDETTPAMQSARSGQNVGPNIGVGQNLSGVDTSITTAGTRTDVGQAVRTNDSLRLALSSMQRQINALSARNDRLETAIRRMHKGEGDMMTTGSVAMPASDAGSSNSAADALQALAIAENQDPASPVSLGVREIRRETEAIAGVDLGSGISFDALRTRWLKIRDSRPAELDGLEARAVLRDGSEGLIAHLIVGPLSSQDAASRLCASLQSADAGECSAVPFEGQPL